MKILFKYKNNKYNKGIKIIIKLHNNILIFLQKNKENINKDYKIQNN